jgi:hypothetical protein
MIKRQMWRCQFRPVAQAHPAHMTRHDHPITESGQDPVSAAVDSRDIWGSRAERSARRRAGTSPLHPPQVIKSVSCREHRSRALCSLRIIQFQGGSRGVHPLFSP